jgi:hypothetical protein
MNAKMSGYVIRIVLVAGLAVALLPSLAAREKQTQDAPASAGKADAAQRPASPESAGATKFKQQCSRCHEAPQGFSSRISGTILRHMRVRASLSAQDERDILRFLNP